MSALLEPKEDVCGEGAPIFYGGNFKCANCFLYSSYVSQDSRLIEFLTRVIVGPVPLFLHLNEKNRKILYRVWEFGYDVINSTVVFYHAVFD